MEASSFLILKMFTNAKPIRTANSDTRRALLRRLWSHFSRRRRWQLVMLLAMIIASSLAEVISLGAVLPFIGVLISPENVFHHSRAADAARAVGISSASQLILPLTIVFGVVALGAAGVRLLVLWASTRLSFAIGVDISIDMYRRTLYQPYAVHVSRNSSEVISGITTKASTVMTGVLSPIIMMLSATFVLCAIIFTLLVIDPAAAIFSAIGFGGCYLIISFFFRYRLKHNSTQIAEEQTQLFKALQEGLGGIRDVLIDGSQPLYCEIYHRADKALRKAQASNTFISASPRFAMEGLGMVLLAALAYLMSLRPGGIGAALPVLAALALGAQRLIPALQQAYASWSTIAGNHASLADTLALLDQPLPHEASQPLPDPLAFHNSILFERVMFRYGDSAPWIIDGIDVEIPKGARVGFVGPTGSGKSTIMDLLMGLLVPTRGGLLIDGVPLDGANLRAWQRNIAHVPQTVFLADASLSENIAFGIAPADIDMVRVREASSRAQIAQFIESQPDGYATKVGERGVRLSGGQRQRIGIARALYKKATVLVFDEATSALDNVTERAVMDAIESLDRDLTVLIIAHRLTTVRRCDHIVVLEGGKLKALGGFDDLLATNLSFQAMARGGAHG